MKMKTRFQNTPEMKEAIRVSIEKLKAMSAEELIELGNKNKDGQVALFLQAISDDSKLFDEQ